jgi:hypothetical protein
MVDRKDSREASSMGAAGEGEEGPPMAMVDLLWELNLAQRTQVSTIVSFKSKKY